MTRLANDTLQTCTRTISPNLRLNFAQVWGDNLTEPSGQQLSGITVHMMGRSSAFVCILMWSPRKTCNFCIVEELMEAYEGLYGTIVEEGDICLAM
jgi:hypothetical protein